MGYLAAAKSRMMDEMDSRAAVTEKAFDEFHLYTLERPATLLDRETKQVQFVSANGVKAPTVYVYDGARIGNHIRAGIMRTSGRTANMARSRIRKCG